MILKHRLIMQLPGSIIKFECRRMGRNSARKNNDAKRRIYRANTRKLVLKLPDPGRAKKASKQRNHRHELKGRKKQIVTEKTETPSSLKFGSINVDGLDIETEEAIRNLIEERKFDVRLMFINKLFF